MKKYVPYILEIIIIFVLLIGYFIKVVIPDYRSELGSSDKLLIANNYVNYIEIKVDNNTDFAFLINKKGIVFHMFFFDKNALNLYNKNIETNNINDALKIMFNTLKDNELYSDQSEVIIYRTSDNLYDEVLNSIKNYCINIKEFKMDLKEKALEYSINADNNISILFSLDIYSKELVSNNTDKSFWQSNNKWSIYADEVYEKIEEFYKEKNITELRIDNVSYPISLIPDDSKTYYPTTNSWYYISEGKVYAFIEFDDNGFLYEYCYQGSMNSKTKGKCD